VSFLEVRNLSARVRGAPGRLLRDVSLSVAAGEVRGLVGESGAGKSMIGKAVLGILPRAVEVLSGEILLDGTDLLRLAPDDRRRRIGASCALIPQDPLTALNPSRRIGPQITDRLVDILGWTRSKADARARDLLAEVQITDPDRVLRQYPHELSGGMRQRVLIASAFAAEPKLIVADEPTTALDVTVQKEVLRLIAGMQARHGTALFFVTHDLGVVSKVCQSLTVLYGGLVVEDTAARDFFHAPAHPYSRALLAATPKYTDPDSSLVPVPQEVLDGVQAQVDAADRGWRNG
jgi:peptide/nickel transport system ATP-binding protein